MEAINDYTQSLGAYRTLIAQQGDAQFLGPITTAGQALVEVSNRVVALQSTEAALAEVLETRQQLEAAEVYFLSTVESALDYESGQLRRQQQAVDATAAQSAILIASLSLLSLVLAIIVAVIIFNSVVAPLRQLSTAAQRLSAGDMDARVKLESTDELGQVAQTFDQMATRIEKLVNDLNARIDETVAARERAERADSVKSAFLASMSHELRTPLNSVINFSKFVVKGLMGPVNERQRDTLEKVVGSARHLLNLINDVLDISKIESGSLNLFVERDVDVNAILASAVSTGEGLLDDKPVKLHFESSRALPLMTVDRQRIAQIILNILSNACKFTQEGEIVVRAEQVEDSVLISVRDTGPGIPAESHAAVFEPFKQTDAGLRSGGGTGLGMPIAKNLAEAHGGKLWLESQPGQGSTFYVSLPIEAPQVALMAQPTLSSGVSAMPTGQPRPVLQPQIALGGGNSRP